MTLRDADDRTHRTRRLPSRCPSAHLLLLLRRGAKAHGVTALHLAVQRGHAGVVRLLLQVGVSLFIADNHRVTPRRIACLSAPCDP